MICKIKYLKYKQKYLQLKLKSNINLSITGGNYYEPLHQKYIEYIKQNNLDIIKQEYSDIFDHGLDDGYYWNETPEYFIKACVEIEKKLNKLSLNVPILNVLCPGDSASKIVKFFQILKKCPKCNFILFSFSRPDHYNKTKTYEYLQNFIPNDFDSIVILDSVCKGNTINMILDTMELMVKSSNSSNSSNTKSNNIVIHNIRKELDHQFKSSKINYKHILNLYDYANISYLEDILFVSEQYGIRCVPHNSTHSIGRNNEKHDIFSCNYFVYVMVLSFLHIDWYHEKYLPIPIPIESNKQTSKFEKKSHFTFSFDNIELD